jgi:hypothetical protein
MRACETDNQARSRMRRQSGERFPPRDTGVASTHVGTLVFFAFARMSRAHSRLLQLDGTRVKTHQRRYHHQTCTD